VFNETTIAIKIEGNTYAVSHPSRNDKWLEEFDIPIDKANEVEVTIYDTVAPGDSAPIGMLWLRISDLMEALRRQKVGAEVQGAGWVTAGQAASMGPRGGHVAPDSATLHSSGTLRQPGGYGGGDAKGPEGIDGWWSVEPAGAISLRLDFGRFGRMRCLNPANYILYSQGELWREETLRGARTTRRCAKTQG
jgi:hypothetical protein